MSQSPASSPRIVEAVNLQLLSEEADAVLALMSLQRAGKPVGEADWEHVFATEPYKELKLREAEAGVPFTDAGFRGFCLSSQLTARFGALKQALHLCRALDLPALGRRTLDYLPDGAYIRAAVFPVIKPLRNSFVYGPASKARVFVYLDPCATVAQLENVIAHELHHIGLFPFELVRRECCSSMPMTVQSALASMGWFREGFAMLSAAGGPGTHPHACGTERDRERWDRDVANFARDRQSIEEFLMAVLRGNLEGAAMERAGEALLGVQGPWYTVGWKMAAAVEQRFGRRSLVECMMDPRLLLLRYNAGIANGREGAHASELPQWRPELMVALYSG
jgi:hypothetical protein